MLQIEELQSMTVVQLRKLAREHGVKLSAGIDKEGIIARLATAPEPEADPQQTSFIAEAPPESGLQATPLSADVTSVAPRTGGYAPPPARGEAPSEEPRQPVYRQAWQARTPAAQPQRSPSQRPAWGQPQRPMNTPSRFGPPANYSPAAPTVPEARSLDSTQPAADAAPKLDGYRLGYRAAPQRPAYQRNEGYRPPYRPDQSFQRPSAPPPSGNAPQQRYGQDVYFNDSLYKPVRDPVFSAPPEPGKPLPDMLTADEGDPVSGMLEILPDGYGFLRAESLLPGKNDIYVSIAQIRRYSLRTGDSIEGLARPRGDQDKFAALLYVEKLNGQVPSSDTVRPAFDDLTPIYPTQRIVLESELNRDNMTVRLIDLIAPVGFGQRAMIISPPDSGRISILREMGKAIKQNDPNAHVMLLMMDAAPEEVTELKESLDAEVFASTFAESPDSQVRVSETMLENAQRLVENGRNVVVLLDSLTKLTRAYQSALTQSGRAMTNTVTPAALVRPKRFFGMARNTREAGSLTIIATVSVETGSRVDDIIFEEFKGTANMELRLCTPKFGDPLFPMIDLQQSATKKDDTLLNGEEKESLRAIRAMLSATTNAEAVAQLIEMMSKTKCNADLFSRLKDWVALWEKSGALLKKS